MSFQPVHAFQSFPPLFLCVCVCWFCGGPPPFISVALTLRVGERGQYSEVKSTFFASARKEIEAEKQQHYADGFQEVENNDHHILQIKYSYQNSNTGELTLNMTILQKKIKEILDWTGLGHCDNNLNETNPEDIYCIVIDSEIAKSVIEKDLSKTEFINHIKFVGDIKTIQV